jgi:hypothetical protein
VLARQWSRPLATLWNSQNRAESQEELDFRVTPMVSATSGMALRGTLGGWEPGSIPLCFFSSSLSEANRDRKEGAGTGRG